MPRKSKTDELREKFEVAIAKGLESDSAAERTQALRSAGDLLNPNLTDLQKQVKQAEDAREVAETALIPLTAERDTLLARVNELQPLADRLPGVEAELSTLKAGNDEWKAEQHKLLVAEAQQCKWDAQRAERESKEALKTAQAEFTKKGYDALLDAMRDLVAANKISQPDIWNLPKNVNPIFLTLWQNWTLTKAQYFVALTQGYPEPTEGFRQMLIRCLRARLPIHGTMPDPIEHLSVRLEVMQMMCAHRWPGVWDQAQRQVDELEAQERGQAMLNNGRRLAEQQVELSRRGYGREPIGQPEAQATDDPHFWNGFIPSNPPIRPVSQDDDPNEVQRVDLATLDYGKRLIDREALAKTGKVIKIDVPESMRRSLDDSEGELL